MKISKMGWANFRKYHSTISTSLSFRLENVLPRRLYSSFSLGDNNRVGDRNGVDKQKKKKPVLEQYDIFSQEDSSANKKTSVHGYGDTCFEVILKYVNTKSLYLQFDAGMNAC